MSGDEGPADREAITTKLRACEACKARKIRCDKLAPCSSCKSANIPCRTARNQQEKRQRVLISNRYEEQLERVNAQLSQLQDTIHNLSKRNSSVASPDATILPKNIPLNDESANTKETPSGDSLYLGESSFEMHSQQASRALESVLKSSPLSALDHDASNTLLSLRGILKPGITAGTEHFSHDLPMPSAQIALKALKIAEKYQDCFFLSTPMMNVSRFKETCQKVYFPVDGYSLSEFIITNGGLHVILSSAPNIALSECDLTPAEIANVSTMCEDNVTKTIEKLGVFVEASLGNIEAILFAAHIAISKSRPNIAWVLTSVSARLCLDSGLHRHKSNPDDPEDNRKKMLFWCNYALDKGLSLNFGRAPTFSDYDITIDYPSLESNGIYDLGIIWLDMAKVQGRMYEKLYSACGQLSPQEEQVQTARILVAELQELSNRCRTTIDNCAPSERGLMTDALLDTDMMIQTLQTLAFRVLPTESPHPLRFAPECIEMARKALSTQQKIVQRFTGRDDNLFRMHIDWNLLFCPFTPFIVIVGTSILNTSFTDLSLLEKVLTSLEEPCSRSAGAKRFHDICTVLYKGAKSCIQQSLSNTPASIPNADTPAPLSGQDFSNAANVPGREMYSTDGAGAGVYWGNGQMQGVNVDGGAGNWPPPQFMVGSTDDMSMLFDNYIVGNSSMMGFFGQDLGNFEGSY